MEGRVLPDRILTELREYAETMAAGASIRDQERTLPFEVFRHLRQLGIGRLRIPVAHGGFGGTVPDLINVVITIVLSRPAVPPRMHAARAKCLCCVRHRRMSDSRASWRAITRWARHECRATSSGP